MLVGRFPFRPERLAAVPNISLAGFLCNVREPYDPDTGMPGAPPHPISALLPPSDAGATSSACVAAVPLDGPVSLRPPLRRALVLRRAGLGLVHGHGF